MTVIKPQKSLLFRPECLPSSHDIGGFGAADPQKINCHHVDPQKALLWTKPRRLSHHALKSNA